MVTIMSKVFCKPRPSMFPDAKKLFVVTHEPVGESLGRNTGYLSRMNECIKVCHKWGIPVLNMTKSELKISDNEVMQERYFHSNDIMHPNEKGYNIYGREIERALLFGTLLS